MAADVAKFTEAIDKVYKTFSTQEVQFDQKEMRGLTERGTMNYIEQKFQQQLQRARSAFLQEFRNHSVVVESEVRRIREELTEKLEVKYGEKINVLRQQVIGRDEEISRVLRSAEASSRVQKHKDEIAQLRGLATEQEELKDKLRIEITQLKEELDCSRQENTDLTHQLTCRDELVAQLRSELAALKGEQKRQADSFAEERKGCDDRIRGLRLEMQQQQTTFKEHLQLYEEKFTEYKAKTEAELQIQDILNSRRSEALSKMEEERRSHIKARTKPTPRIGAATDDGEQSDEEQIDPDDTIKGGSGPVRYRVDDMGMDTSWRDYQLNDVQLVLPARKAPPPRFRVERVRRAGIGPNAPTATDTPRQENHSHQLPPCVTMVLGGPTPPRGGGRNR